MRRLHREVAHAVERDVEALGSPRRDLDSRQRAVRVVAAAIARLPWRAYLIRADEGPGGGALCTVAIAMGRRWELVRVRPGLDPGAPCADASPERSGPASALAAFATARREARHVPGLIVAVYGVDGSGKSTVVHTLVDVVGPAFDGVALWHMFRRQDAGLANVPVTDPHGRAPWPLPIALAKVGWYLARGWLQRTPKVRAARRSGHLVILDRDVADPWIDPRRYRIGAPRWAVSALRTVGPKPDLILALDADAATILARSDEVDAGRLERLLARYRAFARSTARATTVDARRPVDEVRFEAAAVVFEALERRVVGGRGARVRTSRPSSRSRRSSSSGNAPRIDDGENRA